MTPEERRAWNRHDMIRRKARCLAYLGGKCVRCGTTERLEFDHVAGKASKTFVITASLNRRWEVLRAELDKCQLLCKPCHITKSKENGETGGGWNKLAECPHGTTYGYSGPWRCRCVDCKAARAASALKYRRRKQERSRTTKPI